ncbi:hypothetical protein ACSMXN_05215 [Jatrophihabitans sp. DSM 45814]
MPSIALRSWETDRRSRVDELFGAHATVGGTGPGRRTATKQINWALTLCLAAEFQGYVRDLHDEATDVFIDRSRAPTAAVESVLTNLLTLNRQISVKNATASTLQQDFARFGFKVLDEVRVRYVRGARWLAALDAINGARNGIAHSDHDKILIAAGGKPITLSAVKNWDATLRALARAIDRVTAEKLAAITAGDRPW